MKDQEKIAGRSVGVIMERHEGSDHVTSRPDVKICMCADDGRKRITAREFAEIVAGQYKKIFDRSFVTTVNEKDGKIEITAEERDSEQENMTVADVAAWLQTDRRTIRRMTEARARLGTPEHLRLPFFKSTGKLLRFWRSELLAWRERVSKESHAYAPAKGKRKR